MIASTNTAGAAIREKRRTIGADFPALTRATSGQNDPIQNIATVAWIRSAGAVSQRGRVVAACPDSRKLLSTSRTGTPARSADTFRRVAKTGTQQAMPAAATRRLRASGVVKLA